MDGFITTKSKLDKFQLAVSYKISLIVPLITALFYAGIFIFLNPIFNENDDVIMMNIIQGTYTGERSAYVVFINYALSSLLVFLYEFSPNVAWYGTLLYLAMWGSMTILLYILFKAKVHFIMKGIMFLFIINYFLRFGLFLQFSTVSILSTFSGIALYVYAKFNGINNHRVSFTAWTLCVIGYLVRDHTFFIVSFAMLPFLLFLVLDKKIKLRDLKFPAIIMILSIGFFYAVHSKAYSSNPSWSRFLELQQSRQYIHEFTVTQATDPISFEPILRSVGWSHNDYILMLNWLYSDKERYSVTAIRNYVQQMLLTNYGLALSYAPFYLIKQLISPTSIEYFIYTVAMLAVLAVFVQKSNYAISLGFLLALLILGILGRLPDRVLTPLLFCYVFSFILFAKSHAKIPEIIKNKFKKIALIGTVYFVMVIATFVFSVNLFNSNNNEIRVEYYQRVLELMPKNNSEFMIMFPLLLPIQWNNPLSNSIGLQPSTVIFGSWLQQSPHEDMIMEKNKITDVYKALYEMNSVKLLTVDLYLPHIREYLFQHYGAKVHFESLGGFPKSEVFGTDRVKIYRVRLIE